MTCRGESTLSVPIVAGKLQRGGEDARGDVINVHFTDETDTLTLDIKSAYAVKELKTLTRTFVYSRAGAGSLTVTDEVEFTEPLEFGTALVTLGEWKQQAVGEICVSDGNETLAVNIKVEGGDFDIAAEEIQEDATAGRNPKRIGINLKNPVTKATVVVKISSQS